MTRQKLNSFRSNQIEVSYLVLVSKSKEMCRKFPEIRSLSYFKRINGLEFWCLQIPLKVVTFWDEPKLAKSCPANFVPLKKFRVRNNERVTPSDLLDVFDAYIEPQFAEVTIICRNELYMWREYYGKYTFSLIKCLCLNQWVCFSKFLCYFSNSLPRSRTRWECDVKASGNDRVIWRVPLHRKSNIIEWVLRLDDFLKQTGSKAILSPRRASGRLVLGWLWSSEGKGQDGFDVHQVWPFVTVSSTGPNRLEFVLVFRESVPRGLYA